MHANAVDRTVAWPFAEVDNLHSKRIHIFDYVGDHGAVGARFNAACRRVITICKCIGPCTVVTHFEKAEEEVVQDATRTCWNPLPPRVTPLAMETEA